MFANDITLAGDAASSTTYALRGIIDGRSVRGDAASGLSQPRNLVISHQEVKRTGYVANRHLVRLDRTEIDLNNVEANLSVQLVVESPQSIVTAAQVKDAITQLKNFLGTAGYVDKLLNGEP